MNLETLGAIAGAITASAGALRWLIHVYWTQAKTIEDLRKKNQDQILHGLQATVADQKESMLHVRVELRRAVEHLESLQKTADRNQHDIAGSVKAIRDYATTTATRMQQIETNHIKIAKAMILIKGGSSGQQKKP